VVVSAASAASALSVAPVSLGPAPRSLDQLGQRRRDCPVQKVVSADSYQGRDAQGHTKQQPDDLQIGQRIDYGLQHLPERELDPYA